MSAPKLGAITRTNGIAGQVSYSTTVQYEGETANPVTFVGSTYGGPVVLINNLGGQTFVTDPGRFGSFGPEWVRRFFA